MAVLRIGSRGNDVKKLQEGLNKAMKPSPKLKPDGEFGSVTDKAVREFQKKNKLKPDGIVGPKTMAMIDQGGAGGKPGKGDKVEMDVFDYREKKTKVETVMKEFDDVTAGYGRAYDAIPGMAANLMKNAKKSQASFLKGNDVIDGMATKWYPIADKMIKLQEAFKAAEKRGDSAKQKEIKAAIEKLHPQGEKIRKSMEANLKKVETVRSKGYDAIIKDANEIIKLMNW